MQSEGNIVNKRDNNITTVVAIIIVAIVGVFAFKLGDNKTPATASNIPTATSTATDFRTNLVTLGIDHMTLTDQAVDAALDNNADASAFNSALNRNGTDIGTALGSIYGTSAKNTFDKVWQIHLNDFVKFAVADKHKDSAGKLAALKDIHDKYTIPLATFLAKSNPNFSESSLQSALDMHVKMTSVIIDDHVQGNYEAETSELNLANNNIAGIFSNLAQGIVKQYPAKF